MSDQTIALFWSGCTAWWTETDAERLAATLRAHDPNTHGRSHACLKKLPQDALCIMTGLFLIIALIAVGMWLF